MPSMPCMVTPNYNHLLQILVCLLCLVWFCQTIVTYCKSLYAFYALYGSAKLLPPIANSCMPSMPCMVTPNYIHLLPILVCLLFLVWFHQNTTTYCLSLYAFYALYGSPISVS